MTIINKLEKKFYINLLFVFFIFILDRASKKYVIFLDSKIPNQELFSSKFLNIDLIWNEGIAFGLFSFSENYFYNFLTAIIIVMIFFILIMVIKNSGLKKYCLIMVFSGAIGNLYDRIFFKAVPDFIDLHIGNWHWFVFNIADIFITLGVIMLILDEILITKKNYEKN